MSKIRNSLGVLVLPCPNREMTWEEYKAEYGIDLKTVFPYDIVNDSVAFSYLKESKLIYISDNGNGSFDPPLVPLLATSSENIFDDDNVKIGQSKILPIMGYDLDSHAYVTYSTLTVIAYADPDTPNIIRYEEI